MMKTKMKKNMAASGIAALLAVTSVSSVYAAEPAASLSSPKEEVVYVTLDADGTLKDAYVVNSFAGGNIMDYGDYASVKMLNVNAPVKYSGDTIAISSSADKVYYQGNLKSKKIPWNISLHYYLNGKEYTPKEIAGKSGALEIQMKITKNEDCSDIFFQNYALQASLSLDSKKCKNIKASDAIIANAGSSKMLSYTILAGQGIDTKITADVTDFEMSEISINGIYLDLNIELDNAELTGRVNEFTNAIEQLDTGAKKLQDGSGEVLDGSSDLKRGASSLNSGSAGLDDGIVTLQSGLHTVQNGLNSLNEKSSELGNGSSEFKHALKQVQTALDSVSGKEKELTELVTASAKIKKAISDLHTGASALQEQLGYAQYKALMAQNGLNIDEVKAGNSKVIETIEGYEAFVEEISQQISQIPEYKEIVEKYKNELLQATNQMADLFRGNNAAIGGMESYLNGISEELPALTNGLKELQTQYESFDLAIGTLVTNLSSMTGNLSDLAEGINQLVMNYEKLDSGIGTYTDGVARIVSGYSQVTDGVSSLANGSKALVSGSEELYHGTTKLYDGVVSLSNGTKEMSEGTGEFRAETSDMSEKMEQGIDSILDSIGGNMEKPISFVSEKNTKVESVQFVIRTDAVKIKEVEEKEVVEKEEPSFIQKFIALFK